MNPLLANMNRFEIAVRGLLLAICLGTASARGQEPVSVSETDYRILISKAVRQAAEVVLPSIVTIEQVGTAASGGGEVAQDAPTSGVVVSSDGHVLTSSLVVQNPSASLLVTLADGTRKAARVIARDHHRELVLLKIESDTPLTPVSLKSPSIAAPSNARIGQTVIGVGRYGTESSPMVSRGVLSAVGRLDGIAIQTDARVSPSLYGGPLIDLTGQVLGILIPAVAEGGAENITDWYDSGIAFAIPTETIAKNLDRLIAGESIKAGVIGIVARTQDPYDDGTEVATVRVRSPAEEAGIRAGDVIESVAGHSVRRHLDIKQWLGSFDAGDTVAIRLRRGDESLDVDVKLVETIPPLNPQRLGLVVKRLSVDGDEGSQVVVDSIVPGSPAESKFQVEDELTKVGKVDVRDVQSLRRLLLTAQDEAPISVGIRRGGKDSTIEITPVAVSKSEPAELPESLENTGKPWGIEEFKLPDAANASAILAPKADADFNRLGLLMILLNPGGSSPEKSLAAWVEPATRTGVVVCAVAPTDNGRWKPEEIETVSRLAALVVKQHRIDPAAVAIATEGGMSGADAGPSDAMAIAVAITEKRTFSGVAVSAKTRPPAVRVTENDPESPLQFLITGDELPPWSAPLKQAGYPILLSKEVDAKRMLVWTRLLQSI